MLYPQRLYHSFTISSLFFPFLFSRAKILHLPKAAYGTIRLSYTGHLIYTSTSRRTIRHMSEIPRFFLEFYQAFPGSFIIAFVVFVRYIHYLCYSFHNTSPSLLQFIIGSLYMLGNSPRSPRDLSSTYTTRKLSLKQLRRYYIYHIFYQHLYIYYSGNDSLVNGYLPAL